KPVPRNLGSAFYNFVAERRGPSNKNWSYVTLRDGEIAPFGDLAPIKGLVLLERDGGRGAELKAVSRSDILKEIILQNFASAVPPGQILDRLLRIVYHAECYRLRYGRMSSAARLLEDKFGRRSRRRAAAG